jgi:hypothetical protein
MSAGRHHRTIAAAAVTSLLTLHLACGGHGARAIADGGIPPDGAAEAPSSPDAQSGRAATITVNAANVVTTFKPLNVFGNLTPYWVPESAWVAAGPKLQAAGNYFLVYSGGLSQDDFHWNGNGQPDPTTGVWTCSDTVYAPSVAASATYRGTTSGYEPPAHLTDGDPLTAWKSNVDTDFPDHQWVYVDFGSSRAVDRIDVTWGDPYATAFVVQSWQGASYPPPYQADDESGWVDTSAGPQIGTPGTETVSFTGVTTQFLRISMSASSGGPGGAYSIDEVAAFDGPAQITTNVSDASRQTPTVASSMDPASETPSPVGLDFESFMALARSFTPPATPLITVNFSTGSPAEAAAWVHYANVVKGYGIHYWEIGNEEDGNWETGGPLNASDYARRYIAFYEAMKAVDPTILIAGPCVSSPTARSGAFDGKAYLQGFVDRLAADPAGNKAGYAEGVDFHWFPTWQNDDATILASADQWPAMAGQIAGWLSNHPSRATVPILMTSYNATPGSQTFTVQLGAGLWIVGWLGEFIRQFGARGSAHLWAAMNGGNAISSASDGDLGFLQREPNAFQYQERADYWAMQLMGARWALPGSTADHQLLEASASAPLLRVYAAKRPDGALALIVANQDPTTAYAAQIDLQSFVPAATATRHTFDATNYSWETATLPFHAEPDLPPTSGTEQSVSASFKHLFPSYSITVLELTPGG